MEDNIEKDIVDKAEEWKQNIKDFFGRKKNNHADGQADSQMEEPDTELGIIKVMDYTSLCEEVRTIIKKKIGELVKNTDLYPKRLLYIYINDEGFYRKAVKHGLAAEVDEYIENATGKRFKLVEVVGGTPEPGGISACINSYVEIVVSSTERKAEEDMVVATPVTTTKQIPQISMFFSQHDCVVANEPVTLDGNDGQVWNIGWGQTIIVDNRPRKNHIALTYSDPQRKVTNMYPVSRAHAHIKKVDGSYLLFVDVRGTRAAGKRTKIVRNEKEMELSDVKVGIPLQDGDIIRLNKEYLSFKLG